MERRIWIFERILEGLLSGLHWSKLKEPKKRRSNGLECGLSGFGEQFLGGGRGVL